MTSAYKDTTAPTKDSELAHLVKDMATFRLKFIEATKEFVDEWYDTVSSNYSNIKKEITANLSREQLFEMRDRIGLLHDLSDDQVEMLLSDSSLWYDLDQSGENANDRYKSIEKFMPEGFKYILGSLGEILVDYGYVARSKFGADGFVAEQDGTGRYRYKFNDLYFPSDSMKRSFDRYWEFYKYAIRL
ncbi:MAG: hypothetical protein Kapaf2KO_05690 [Candidatus Kapaibacteriales bacterium]